MTPLNIMPETWAGAGSAIVTVIFFWNMIRQYCPPELKAYLQKCTSSLSGFLNPNIQISINQYIGIHLTPHQAYNIVEAYLSANSTKAKCLKAEMRKENDTRLMLTMDANEKITDVFNGVQVKWISGKVDPPSGGGANYREPDRRYYKLEFHKVHKRMITGAYLEHVIEMGKAIKARNRQPKLYTNGRYQRWTHIAFEHPAKFATLAMEPKKKEAIIEDLLTFTKSKDFYARIGKAWKRGYLLYPGTGKSTMIAAMANLLHYDVYDLELTSVQDNTELRKLLTETTARSIIVIEDIDCSLNLTGQRSKKSSDEKVEKDESGGSKVTLSGLLNFIDGLWSACAGERIIVFTTNYVDKLDPALTRRGRMDKHIVLSYCKYDEFKELAKIYLDLEAHPLFKRVKELIEEVEITPADVAENLKPNSAEEGPEECLENLISALEEKKEERMHAN